MGTPKPTSFPHTAVTLILSAHFFELTKSERVKRSVFRVFEHLGALYPLEFYHQYTTDTHLCTASILISPGHADM